MSNDKPKDSIYMGGRIAIGGTDIAARLKRGEKIIFEEGGRHVETVFYSEPRLTDQVIEMTPWFSLKYAALDIETPDPNFDEGTLAIEFNAAFGRSLGIEITIEQAITLQDILADFIKGFEARASLEKILHVDAPEDGAEEATPLPS